MTRPRRFVTFYISALEILLLTYLNKMLSLVIQMLTNKCWATCWPTFVGRVSAA